MKTCQKILICLGRHFFFYLLFETINVRVDVAEEQQSGVVMLSGRLFLYDMVL